MATQQRLGLCGGCKAFDVKALLLLADQAPGQPDNDKRWNIADAIPKYFRLSSDLNSLKHSADSCDLCRAVWQELARQRAPDKLKDDALNTGIGKSTIYLGTLNWDRNATKAPYVAAIQYHPEKPDKLWRAIACFEICADPEAGTTYQDNHLLARLQAPSSSDEMCFALANQWLRTCLWDHRICRRLSNKFFPTRILDVSNDTAGVRLVDGKRLSKPYSALSYCWGGQNDVLLTQDSERELRRGVPMSILPAALQDAVVVTRKLGIAYVWIDALCIFQDQNRLESLQDWLREAGGMRDVYSGAVVTIEAAASSRAGESFLSCARSSSQPYCALSWGEGDAPLVYLRPSDDINGQQLFNTKIHTRGWTLQERILAPRTLAFGTQMISFECAQSYFDESGMNKDITTTGASRMFGGRDYDLGKDLLRQLRSDDWKIAQQLRPLFRALTSSSRISFQIMQKHFYIPLYGDDGIGGPVLKNFYDVWRRLVTRFTERLLTSARDRLPALSGIAQEFQHALKDEYVAGMWKSELVKSLAWTCGLLYNPNGPAIGHYDRIVGRYIDSRGTPAPNPEKYASSMARGDWPASIKSTTYLAPSWSWASVQGKISFHFGAPNLKIRQKDQRIVKHAEIVTIQTEPLGDDKFGALKSCRLTLRAPMLKVPAPHLPCDNNYPLKTWHDHIRTVDVDSKDNLAFATEYWQHHEGHDHQDFAIMKLFTIIRDREKKADVSRTLMVLLLESVDGTDAWRRLCCVTLYGDGAGNERLEDVTEFKHYHEVDRAPFVTRTIVLV